MPRNIHYNKFSVIFRYLNMRCNKSLSYCSNSLTTSRGTYTFHQEKMTKAKATKFCEAKGQILAPITSQEEFDTIHNHVVKCRNLCGYIVYHIGLYVLGKDLKIFSNHETWDSAKHEGLFDWYSREDDDYFQPYYMPFDNRMTVETIHLCKSGEARPICFKAADNPKSNSEALVNSKVSNTFTSSGFLTAVVVLVAMGFCAMAVALFISVRKLKNLKQKLPVSIN